MRILQQHVDFIEYEPIEKEFAYAEESDRKKHRLEDALVLFTSIEEGDSEEIVAKAIDEMSDFAKKLKVKRVLVYPFVHLSNKPERPQKALALLKQMEADAKAKGFEVHRAPFGWNKQYQLKIKGHPLAEQSRSYDGGAEKAGVKKGGEEAAGVREEEKVKSAWYILEPSGKLTEVGKFDFLKHKNLKKFADYEMAKVRAYQQIPEHIKLMRKLELVDFEAGSDPGNFRFYPNGRLVKSLLESYVTQKTVQYGAMEVETPIMYDYEHPAFKEYLGRFPARHYVVQSDDKDFFLRFSACFGQFLIMHDATISYKQLPFKVYELTRYSFRREKSGELAGLKRLRAFTMPDMHTVCKDLEQAKHEFEKQFEFCQEIMKEMGIRNEEYEAAIRFTTEFWEKNKDFVVGLVKNLFKRPALVEMWSFRFAYFDPKFEFNVVDAMGKAAALSTVQIDHENSKRYGVVYTGADGKKEHAIILHCSPSGAVERVIYALLELAAIRQKEGKVPGLPLWLSPTQVRFLPISDKHIDACMKFAEQLKGSGLRADIDDTNETLDKKIRNAEQEWVPYICVVGDKELQSGDIAVRVRETKKQEKMKLKDLSIMLNKELGELPRAEQSLPMLLSKRPIFVG